MFKFGTFAMVIFALIAQPSYGEVDCTRYVDGWVTAVNKTPRDQTLIDELKAAKDSCEAKQTRQVGECKSNAESEYTQAVKDLQDACDSMGLRSNTNSSIGCSYNVEQCRCATKGLTVTQKAYLKCDQVDTSKMKYCPEVTEAMKDRMEKRRDKAEDNLKGLKDKLRSMSEEENKGDDKAAEAARTARQAKLAAEKEYSQGIAEAKADKNKREQDRIQKMSEFEDKMQASQTVLRTKETKIRNAARKLESTKVQIRMSCINTAQASVNALQTDAVNNIRQGTYNRGNQTDIFREVGLTDRQHWQQQVNKRVNWCMASPETRSAQDLANEQLNADKDGINDETNDAQAQLELLQKQMSLIQVACTGGARAANGEVVQSQACRDKSDIDSKVEQLATVRKASLDAAQEDEDQAKVAAEKAKTATLNKTGSLLQEINGQEDLLRKMDEADTVNASYPGNTNSEERAKLLSTKFAAAIDEAIQVKNCCQRTGSTINSQSCTSAKKFLDELGRTSAPDTPPRSGPAPGEDGNGAGAGV